MLTLNQIGGIVSERTYSAYISQLIKNSSNIVKRDIFLKAFTISGKTYNKVSK